MAMSATYLTMNGMIVHENRGGAKRDYVPDTLGSTSALVDNIHDHRSVGILAVWRGLEENRDERHKVHVCWDAGLCQGHSRQALLCEGQVVKG
jgi:hypothetical protein